MDPRPDPAARDSSARRRKTARIAAALEALYGVPRWKGRRDPLDCLIETILSQSTNDRNRERAFAELTRRFPSWAAVAESPTRTVADAIRVAGLANQKSGRIQAVLRWVKEQFGGYSLDAIETMDSDAVFDLLCTQKGIGKKTVAILLAFGLGRDVFAVDTHVHRIAGRLGLIGPRIDAARAHDVMARQVPEGKSYSFHVNLIRFGREICHARKPECGLCPVRRSCLWWRAAAKTVEEKQ